MGRGAALATAVFLLAGTAPVAGHGNHTDGFVTVPVLDRTYPSVFPVAKSLSNQHLPNGLVSHTFLVTGTWLFLLEHATGECSADFSFGHADFDIYFTAGSYGNGPCEESGTVPGADGELGWAVVTLFCCLNREFLYHEIEPTAAAA